MLTHAVGDFLHCSRSYCGFIPPSASITRYRRSHTRELRPKEGRVIGQSKRFFIMEMSHGSHVLAWDNPDIPTTLSGAAIWVRNFVFTIYACVIRSNLYYRM